VPHLGPRQLGCESESESESESEGFHAVVRLRSRRKLAGDHSLVALRMCVCMYLCMYVCMGDHSLVAL
jgi:hypothetical protein